MEITIGKNKYNLEFTFNSFRHMGDIDFGELEEIESKPFKIIGFTEDLLLGALNYTPNNVFNRAETSIILEEYMNEGGNLVDLVEILTGLLEESQFFKNLQMTNKE